MYHKITIRVTNLYIINHHLHHLHRPHLAQGLPAFSLMILKRFHLLAHSINCLNLNLPAP